MGAHNSAIRRRSVMSNSEAYSYLLNLASRLNMNLGESKLVKLELIQKVNN